MAPNKDLALPRSLSEIAAPGLRIQLHTTSTGRIQIMHIDNSNRPVIESDRKEYVKIVCTERGGETVTVLYQSCNLSIFFVNVNL